MSRLATRTIPAQELNIERRTCFASQSVTKNANPVFTFVRESIPVGEVENATVDRAEQTHRRKYSDVAAELVSVADAGGNIVSIPVASVFQACSQCFDKWAQEDGEIVS